MTHNLNDDLPEYFGFDDVPLDTLWQWIIEYSAKRETKRQRIKYIASYEVRFNQDGSIKQSFKDCGAELGCSGGWVRYQIYKCMRYLWHRRMIEQKNGNDLQAR